MNVYTTECIPTTVMQDMVELIKWFIGFVFALNEWWVQTQMKAHTICDEYVVAGAIRDIFLWVNTGVVKMMKLTAKSMLCKRIEPVFATQWMKIGYFSIVDVIYDEYKENAFVFNPFSVLCNSHMTWMTSRVYIEDYVFDEPELAKVISPIYVSEYTANDSMMFVRKLATGEKLVRQLFVETVNAELNDELLQWTPEKSNARLLMVFVQFDDPAKKFDILIPDDEYYVGNEILSEEYILSYMEHQWIWKTHRFNHKENYVVRIMDDDLNVFTIQKNEYIRIEKDRVVISYMEPVDQSESEDQDESESENQDDESGRDIRTVSLDSESSTLMLSTGVTNENEDENEENGHRNKKIKFE